ncbi:hypothetical protein CVT24_001788 [Panaeolus cyanescens]|uniref:Tyrosine specific protein phosphatases domain-containing protein n=1 Tax=Panaeolus cyanescens TaxID=181874 RepID=A0A409YUE5_9AGAR|nr:hypothetical protein CVT24_001788 [Panaeolus cyanescens]
MSRKPPAWLETAVKSDKYIRMVFIDLEEREVKRDAARNSTRHRQDNEFMGHAYRRVVDKNHATHYSIAIATHPSNEGSNRYTNVEPYDRSRVIVQSTALTGAPVSPASSEQLDPHGRYLNASWVLEKFGQKWWIANQAPLPNTAHAFLSVILQPVTQPQVSGTALPPFSREISRTSRVRTVVQLTRNIEDGRRKADAYFPTEVGRSVVLRAESGYNGPPLAVKLLHTNSHADTSSIESIISISPFDDITKKPNEGKAVIFRHLLYLKWPDHGVPEPEDTDSLLAFVHQVHRLNKDLSIYPAHQANMTVRGVPELDPDPPIMVGCSAGIGRTGSFVVLSSLLRHFGFLDAPIRPSPSSVLKPSPLGPLPDNLTSDLVAQEVDSLREQRPGMVQRPEQVALIYQVLMDAFMSQT